MIFRRALPFLCRPFSEPSSVTSCKSSAARAWRAVSGRLLERFSQAALLLAVTCTHSAFAQANAGTVVFWQPGFPAVASEAPPREALLEALGAGTTFASLSDLSSISRPGLIVLPYGSAFPAAAWPIISHFLREGTDLLLLGGEPLRVPVEGQAGAFHALARQDSYSHPIGLLHSYPVPGVEPAARFAWRPGYSFLPPVQVHAATVFAQEGRLQGLGYLEGADGTHRAAPVIFVEHSEAGGMAGGRIVALPFTPAAGYWASADGVSLIRTAADYARGGPTSLTIETQYAALRPGERAQMTLHLRQPASSAQPGTAHVEVLHGERGIAQMDLPLGGPTSLDTPVPFSRALDAGMYTIRATWTPAGASRPQEFAENGFIVEDAEALSSGAALASHGDFLSLGDKPFFPVGTNYFSTEANGWDFSGPRDAAVWDHDFADMQRHGVNFVRTGVWMANSKFVEPLTGGANERFLRNLEAFLSAAHRHDIAVNFTFFAFSPRSGEYRRAASPNEPEPVSPNPYLDPATLEGEHNYVRSVLTRFHSVPWLSYDLINEPSFSNPRVIFHGNVPNNDPAEVSAWQTWLQQHYGSLSVLADAWRTTPGQLGDWKQIALPRAADLSYERNGDANAVRAVDYNLFAQDSFSAWVRGMVTVIRATGSSQLINVGQDEGGVTNRVLNQFYATAGVSFTTNHTYWQDQALLWDSVAAKRPGLPNITGETGYQPAWNPDGSWRYDELTGTAIEERKWALGFAAGSSGAMQWDWDREFDFGMQRSDGSAKVWEDMMRELGEFARKAAPYATSLTLPQIAIVLPQSLQLSTYNSQALEAQQNAVRVLYQYNRAEAYAVGEYQTDTLGSPKLILLPSAYGLTDQAWAAIEARVRAGAVLLISGPFNGDAHLHATDRAEKLGAAYTLEPLQERYQVLDLPTGGLPLVFADLKTTVLDRAALPGGATWQELALGQGKVLFSAFPLELNSNLDSIAAAYQRGIEAAHIEPTYTTEVKDPGLLICPTRLPHATLYVLSSETSTTKLSFRDSRSGKTFSGTLAAGHAALLLVGEKGDLLASYRWHPVP